MTIMMLSSLASGGLRSRAGAVSSSSVIGSSGGFGFLGCWRRWGESKTRGGPSISTAAAPVASMPAASTFVAASSWSMKQKASSSSSLPWSWTHGRKETSRFGFDRPVRLFSSTTASSSSSTPPSSSPSPSTTDSSTPSTSTAPSSSPEPPGTPSGSSEASTEGISSTTSSSTSETSSTSDSSSAPESETSSSSSGEPSTEGKQGKEGRKAGKTGPITPPFRKKPKSKKKMTIEEEFNQLLEKPPDFGMMGALSFLFGFLLWWYLSQRANDPEVHEEKANSAFTARTKKVSTLAELMNYLKEGKVKSILVRKDHVAQIEFVDAETGELHFASEEGFFKSLEELEAELGVGIDQFVPVRFQKPPNAMFWWTILYSLPLLIYLSILLRRTKRMEETMSLAKSASRLSAQESKVRFNDVAGLEEAKVEIMEFVDFLKTPEAFEAMGAKCPKGLLLSGPPGTGKTLLAKAVAGEAGVKFFNASGPEFIELYVGVGPARVRDLFNTARKNTPCIIWIDEIDSIGGKRGGRTRGRDEELHNTLNQLLVEMDGFHGKEGVVVMASTNRVKTLDPALLRAGRFDRQIEIGLPDLAERKDILKIHLKKLKLEKPIADVATHLAPLTPGLSGADLANICNEGAIFAARRNVTAVGIQDLVNAVDRVVGGIERKKAILPEEKERIAYHEAGHVIVGWFLEHARALLKVSIVPRGSNALGYSQYATRERFIVTQEQINDHVCVALGGRAAEMLKFGDPSSGASNDLKMVTEMAYEQFGRYGFSSYIGPIGYKDHRSGNYHRLFSESVAEGLDNEVREYLQKCFERCRDLLSEKRELLEVLSKRLLEKEKLEFEEILEVLGPRPYPIDDPTLEAYFKSRALEREQKGSESSKTEDSSTPEEEVEPTAESAPPPAAHPIPPSSSHPSSYLPTF